MFYSHHNHNLYMRIFEIELLYIELAMEIQILAARLKVMLDSRHSLIYQLPAIILICSHFHQ